MSRFLVAYEAAGVSFSLVLNKADLVAPEVLAGRLAQCRWVSGLLGWVGG